MRILKVAIVLAGVLGLAWFVSRSIRSLKEQMGIYDANERLWSYLCEDRPSVGRVRDLLDQGAYPNFQDAGFTTFQVSLQSGNPEIVELLIRHGGKVNGDGYEFEAPLIRAAANGQIGVVRVLLDHGANVNARDYKGRSALRYLREAELEAHSKGDERALANNRQIRELLKRAGGVE